MWWGEKVYTCNFRSFLHNRARPPPKFLLGTINKLSNFNRHLNLSKYDFFFLVSIKNTKERSFAFTRSESSRTRRGFPSPKQFQLTQFMVNGEARRQPPLMGLIWKEPHLITPLFSSAVLGLSSQLLDAPWKLKQRDYIIIALGLTCYTRPLWNFLGLNVLARLIYVC